MALEGSLELFALPEILQMVSVQKKTGILTVQGEQDIIAISFLEGQVVAADALNQTVEEGLGQVLASQGLVSPEDFDQAVRDHQSGGGRLVDLLLERGLLDRFDLLNALRQHTFHLLVQLLGWTKGEFKFYGGDEVSFEEGMVPISVEELLIRSVQEMGEEEAQEGMPSLAGVYERLASNTPVKVLGRDGDTPEADGSVWLSPDEVALLERLDGRQTAAAHAAATGLGDYKVLYALYRLLKAELVRGLPEVGGEDVPFAPAPAPVPSLEPPPRIEPVPSSAPPQVEAVPPPVMEMPLPEPSFGDEDEPDAFGESELASEPELDTGPAPFRRRSAVLSAETLRWILHPVALFALVFLVVAARGDRGRVLFPFPWLQSDRSALEAVQNQALARKIERAANTYFLLEGRFPDELRSLQQSGLLSAEDLRDVRGNAVVFLNEEDHYRLSFVDPSRPGEGIRFDNDVRGNFLLDAEFLATPRPTRSPVVLVD